MDDLFKDAHENKYGQHIVYMKGFWTTTLKDKIPTKSNNWMTMTFETRGYPRNKPYGWEMEVCKRLKYKFNTNIEFYENNIKLSKKRFKSCELYLQK